MPSSASAAAVPVADCAFCAIAAGATEADIVFEDETSLAFLDHRPLFPGHSLLSRATTTKRSATCPTT